MRRPMQFDLLQMPLLSRFVVTKDSQMLIFCLILGSLQASNNVEINSAWGLHIGELQEQQESKAEKH